jgi:hypothetical protein
MIKNKKLIERNLRHRARHKRSLNVLTVHLSTGFDLATLYVMAKEDGFGPVGGKRWERSPQVRCFTSLAVNAIGHICVSMSIRLGFCIGATGPPNPCLLKIVSPGSNRYKTNRNSK